MAEETIKKPTYDARQKYVELLIKRLDMAGEAINDDRLHQAYLELQQVFQLVKPWIGDTAVRKIERHMEEARRAIKPRRTAPGGYPWAEASRRQANTKTAHQLLDITGELTQAAKHMLLPSGTADDEGDIEDWGVAT